MTEISLFIVDWGYLEDRTMEENGYEKNNKER